MSDPSDRIAIEEMVNVQLLSPDGTAMDVPFTRKEFDRLSREAQAANTEVGEYIKNKVTKTVTADRAIVLRLRAGVLRSHVGDHLEVDPLGMREALEAINAGLGDAAVEDILEYSAEQLASTAFLLVATAGQRVREGEISKQDLKSLRERFAVAEAEIAQKTAVLRAINREGSTERLEARLAEARASERAVIAIELETQRSEIARQRSEIDELRAAKKKLREALERTKEKRT